MDNGKRGQSLLVIVLLISVVFTLVATASYRFTTETQTSKLQEESVRTLAAADSGIERGLQLAASQASYNQNFTQAFSGTNVALDGINKTASTIDIAKTQERTFVTSTIDKDEQYLFYLYDYPSGTNYYRNNFNIYYASSSGVCGASRTLPALEMTLIYGAGAQNDKVVRYVLDPCRDGANLTKIRESETGGNQTVRIGDKCSPACSVGGVPFNHFGNMVLLLQPIGADNPKTLIVRVLFAPTILGFQIDPARPFDRFYAQGQKIQVTAVSNTGVSKVVNLFKSNPQIPADLFVTTF